MNGNRKKAEKYKNEFGKIKDDFFDFERIGQYFTNSDKEEAFQVISDRTYTDLDFEELFRFIDRTVSRPGQQYLYKNLRVIQKRPGDYERREKTIGLLTHDENTRIKIQLLLAKLDHADAYNIRSLFQDEPVKPPDWFYFIKILGFTSLAVLVLIPVFPALLFVLLPVFLINLIIHYWNKQNLYQYAGSVPQLLRLTHVARNLIKFPVFDDRKQEVSESLRVVDRLRNRMSFFRLEAKIDNDFSSIVWYALELVKITFLLEPLILFNIIRHLKVTGNHIHNLFTFTGETDMALSIASLRKGLPYYCHPELTHSGKLMDIIGIYHPLVIDCVPNSLKLKDKSVLITGSNMSGKTTFIRTIGMNAITGMAINTCFAEKFEIPEMKILSAIRITDDLMNDKSYYFEEVLTIREMINNTGNSIPNLFLLDEIYKGTNTVERVAAGKAVLSKLNRGNNFIFVSTHDIELADLLESEYELYNFSEIVADQSIGFDYKLKPGKLKTRNAISILEINEYPKEVIAEAKEIAAKMDENNRTRNLHGSI